MPRIRSRVVETESVNQRMLRRGAVKRQHISRWAVGHSEIAPGVIGGSHLGPNIINETHLHPEVLGLAAAGRTIHLTSGSHEFDDTGQTVEFTTEVGERVGFAAPTLPATSVTIPAEGVWTPTVTVEFPDGAPLGTTVTVLAGGVAVTPLSGAGWVAPCRMRQMGGVVAGISLATDAVLSVKVDAPTGETVDGTVHLTVKMEGGAAAAVSSTSCPVFGANTALTSSGTHDAFPGLAIAPNGDRVVAWRQASGHNANDGVTKVSRYTSAGVLIGTATVLSGGGYDWGNPSLTLLDDGSLLMLAERRTTGGVNVVAGGVSTRSTDSGASWSTPVVIGTSFTGWMRSPSPALEMPDGTLLAALYGTDTGDTHTSVRLARSTDGAASWSHYSDLVDGPALGRDVNETGLVRLGTTITAIIRENTAGLGGAGGIWHRAASTDIGLTWSGLSTVASNAGGAPKPLVRANGDIVAVMRNLGVADYPATLIRSADGGVTWGSCQTLAPTTSGGFAAYAQMAEDADGVLHLAHAYESSETTSVVYYAAAA